ncbi:MAG: SpoIIE family protein phosphatase [Deltaproteobacteria bacterium]|nr:SpoIIE family protein phosphatase [Deltaproteobacteria bacterium]
MLVGPWNSTKTLNLLGGIAFVVAVLSIVDMFIPRPFDGVILNPDISDKVVVMRVAPGSGADLAGIQPGDQIRGIARNILQNRQDAARLLRRFEIGQEVAYFIKKEGQVGPVTVVLGEHRYANSTYVFACLLGFSFFFIGFFVLQRQPRMRASQVFFLLCSLFLVFLVCRLRPASYSEVDALVLSTGTVALLLLPACFLHFFLIFPRPLPLIAGWLSTADRTLWRRLLLAIYLLPALAMAAALLFSKLRQVPLALISGAPVANWWVLAGYMLTGLGILAANARSLDSQRERRGAIWVLVGSIFGLVPFLVVAVAFPSFLHTEQFLIYGIVPLGLVPLTFAYAIVRFQLLDIRVILHKGLLYTATTAVITGLYALGIAFFNTWFSGTTLAASRFFPLVFALAIVLLFEPLRRRIQGPVDRFFFGEESRLQKAMVEMGEALTGQVDLEEVVRDLVEELPRLLGLHFSALYLVKGEDLERVAGPATLPKKVPLRPVLDAHLDRRQQRLQRLASLTSLRLSSTELALRLEEMEAQGVELVGDLASSRRRIGAVLLSGKTGQMDFEPAELELLSGLLSHAALALENSLLLEERTQQAELKREVEIASSIQSSLLPDKVSLGPGWDVAAVCRPARDVGGDFLAQLPGPGPQDQALVYGDVSGKSVPGALMMMAAHEVLHSLAMTHSDPEELLDLANRRLYQLSKRSFVAVGYLAAAGSEHLLYSLAGQPSPLLRGIDGSISELEPPTHRMPLGALAQSSYTGLETPIRRGELVLAYSDGVVETVSPRGEFFGEDRLHQTLLNSPAEPAAALDHILATLEEFSQGHAPYDDLTLVAIRRHPETAP